MYYSEADTALREARAQLYKRPGERIITQTEHGYRVINPRDHVRHYGLIVARMTYARDPNTKPDSDRRIPAWLKVIPE